MPKAPRTGGWAGPFSLFAILSLAAVAVGGLVVRANGTPAGEWARDLAAWVVGAILAAGLSRSAGRRALLAFVAVTPFALAATLVSGGQQGVHRWLQLGPLRMNVAEVLLPACVVALAVVPVGRGIRGLAAGLVLLLLIAQPDASQTTAFGGALIVLIASAPASRAWRAAGVALVGLAILGSWLRPDPLGPVPEVEGIMGLAWRLSPVAAVLAWTALAGVALAPLMVARSGARTAAVALSSYAALSSLAPLAGAFPVPLVGMGMSPILGLWLGMGLLLAVRGAHALTFAPPHAPFRAS